MSEHKVTLSWSRTSENFDYKSYNREHVWTFKNGLTVDASAATAFWGSPDCVDPEEAFVAALSSCHMLTFLAIACKKKFVVDAYEDNAVGFLEKNTDGKLAVTRVELKPRIQWQGTEPSKKELQKIHHIAHKECFLANSVKTHLSVVNM